MRHDNGGGLLAAHLKSLGVDTVFGIVSVHNLPLVEAVEADPELRFVPVRHEASAVNAADAHGRARGSIGCALTSTGTGAGNAAGSLIEALSSGTAVLHITGQVESAHLGSGRGFIHETKDQLGMLAAVSTYAATVTSARDAGRVLREASAAALAAPGGPASVEWPIDLQYAVQEDDGESAPASGAPVPDASALAGARDLLATARRPLIWAGGGATTARDQLLALLETTGAGLLTSNSGRGSVPEDHEQVVGNFATTPAARALLADADVLVTVGTHFRSNETADYGLRLPRRTSRSTSTPPPSAGSTRPGTPSTATRGGPATAHRGRRTGRRGLDRPGPAGARGGAGRAARRHRPPGGDLRRPRRRPAARRRRRPGRHHPLVRLGQPPPADPRPAGQRLPPRRRHRPGPRHGHRRRPRPPDEPTVVIAGDGGLAVHLGELLTLAQERPRLTLIVFNDGGYGVLRNMQATYTERRSGVDLFTPDFARLAAACSLPYARIGDASEAAKVIDAAVASDGPTLVEADLAALGPMRNPFTPPVKIPTR